MFRWALKAAADTAETGCFFLSLRSRVANLSAFGGN